MPYDQIRITTLALYADAVFLADAADTAEPLYGALRPFSEVYVTNGAQCFAHVRAYLGMLAAVLGRHRVADEHFEAACALQDRDGIAMWGPYTRVAWAEALERRGDTVRAREQAERARAVASVKGYAMIERRAVAVLEAALDKRRTSSRV